MALDGSETHKNLLDAFAHESQQSRRYQWFAEQGDIEGQPAASTLFRAISANEASHAHDALEFLIDVGDPVTGTPIGDAVDNLRAAIESEQHDAASRYTAHAETARAEGHADVAEWFETLAKAEKSHAGRFSKALDGLEKL